MKSGASPQLVPFIKRTLTPGIYSFVIFSIGAILLGRWITIAPYMQWIMRMFFITSSIAQANEWISVFMTADDYPYDTFVLTTYLTMLQGIRFLFLYKAVAAYLEPHNLTVGDAFLALGRKLHIL